MKMQVLQPKKGSRRKAILIGLLLIEGILFAGADSHRDSLEHALAESSTNNVRMSLICELAILDIKESQVGNCPATIKDTLIQMLNKSLAKKYLSGEGLARYGLGAFHQRNNDIQAALPQYKRAITLFQQLHDHRHEYACYERLLILYQYKLGDIGKSDYYARKVIEGAEYLKRDMPYSVYLAYYFLGSHQRNLYDLDSSQFYLQEAIKFGKQNQTRILDAYVLLAYNAFNQLDFFNAITYAHGLIEAGQSRESIEEEMWGWGTLGSFYSDLKNHASASTYFAKAAALAQKTTDAKSQLDFQVARLISEAYLMPDGTKMDTVQLLYDSMIVAYPCSLELWLDLVPLYLLAGKEEIAMATNDTLISYATKCETNQHLAILLKYQADMLLNKGRYAAALKASKRAYALAFEGEDPYRANEIRFLLSRSEAAVGNITEAGRLYHQAAAIRDNIDLQRLQAIESLARQLEQDQARVKILEQENTLLLAQQQKRQLLISLILLGLFGTLILIAVSVSRRRIQKQAQQLTSNLNIQLDELTENIHSHTELLSDSLREKVEELSREFSDMGQQIDQQINSISRNPKEKLKALKRIISREQQLFDMVRTTALQKEEDLRSFTYMVSHDLKAPLSTAVNYIDQLRVRTAHQLDDDTRQYLDTFEALLYDMQAMIDGMAKYAQADKIQLQKGVIEPEKVLKSVIPLIKGSSPKDRNIAQEIEIESPLPSVYADPLLFRHVLTNLLTNAVKATQLVGHPRIRIFGKKTSRQTILTIEDNGIGIPPQNQYRLFQLFKSAHDRKRFPGTGIGLAIVKRIVERHEGSIELESEGEGKGTRFILYLPK